MNRRYIELMLAHEDSRRTLRDIGDVAIRNGTLIGQVPARHPWVAEQVEILRAHVTDHTAKRCPHAIGSTRSLVAFTHLPGLVLCQPCAENFPRPGVAEEMTCDRCQRYSRDLKIGITVAGPALLYFALCRGCVADMGMDREQVSA